VFRSSFSGARGTVKTVYSHKCGTGREQPNSGGIRARENRAAPSRNLTAETNYTRPIAFENEQQPAIYTRPIAFENKQQPAIYTRPIAFENKQQPATYMRPKAFENKPAASEF
jgi:hypothetical protein